MTRAQRKALTDYCREFGYTWNDVLKELKANGTVDKSTRLEELGQYTNGTSYDAMLKFLGDNI